MNLPGWYLLIHLPLCLQILTRYSRYEQVAGLILLSNFEDHFFPPRNSHLLLQHTCWCESMTVDSCSSLQKVAASNNCVLGPSLCSFETIVAVMNCIQHLQIFGGF
jgi:hypothetical protein